MPIPLYIRQRPARLRSWLAGRRELLARFERLTNKGLPERLAASTLGLTLHEVRALRENLEAVEGEGRRLRARGYRERLDLELSTRHPANVRQGWRTARHQPERLSADDLAAEREGGIHRAWKWVRRTCTPYQRRAATLPTATV